MNCAKQYAFHTLRIRAPAERTLQRQQQQQNIFRISANFNGFILIVIYLKEPTLNFKREKKTNNSTLRFIFYTVLRIK